MRKRFDVLIWLFGDNLPHRLQLLCTFTQAKQMFYALALCSLRSNLVRCSLIQPRDDGKNGGFDELDYFCRKGDLCVPDAK